MSLRFSHIALVVVSVVLLTAWGCSEKPEQPPADNPNPPVEGATPDEEATPDVDDTTALEIDWGEDLDVAETQSGKSGRAIGRVLKKVAADKDAGAADDGGEPSGLGAALSEVPNFIGDAAGQIAPDEGAGAPEDQPE